MLLVDVILATGACAVPSNIGLAEAHSAHNKHTIIVTIFFKLIPFYMPSSRGDLLMYSRTYSVIEHTILEDI